MNGLHGGWDFMGALTFLTKSENDITVGNLLVMWLPRKPCMRIGKPQEME